MKIKNLQIVELKREPAFDDNDTLILTPGVNVITGEKDAGKTVWLKMLDYIMADDDKPEDAFGADVAAKYSALHAVFRIGEVEYKVERRWKEKGVRTKVFLDGIPMDADNFGRKLLELLCIPLLRYPKGNPYEERTWPEIGWRTLYRHVYRQERFWTDFADKQPDAEQHACVCQFMGVASQVFPKEYGELVAKQRELFRLQAQVENFSLTLQTVSNELVRHQELSVAVDDESIIQAETRLNKKLSELAEEKGQMIQAVDSQQGVTYDSKMRALALKRGNLGDSLASQERSRNKLALRSKELVEYRDTLQTELTRLQRALASSDIIADLKVTQCPACDQSIKPSEDSNFCYLCGRPHATNQHDHTAAHKRVEFESDRINEEIGELNELVAEISSEAASLEKALKASRLEVAFLDR